MVLDPSMPARECMDKENIRGNLYEHVEQHTILQARAAELDGQLLSINKVRRFIEEFNGVGVGVATDIQVEMLAGDA
ncbi:hypothetical protein C2845_PM16G01520 [Panicum miliaceum]|uniref:Uncharacterized protein n=1 Tax=Panicum miliaceum TaxID=4540 RepID=A0A3L6PRV5_PANMI|nr:hypothetical protein C2845_PM16G01520 [Panicum miliaceum]